MLIVKLLGVLFALIFLYILLLLVCSLPIDPKREYETHSPFYRYVLNTATAIALKGARVRLHVTGLENIPADTKNLLFVGNHRSKFDPIISWYVLRRWKPAYISKSANFRVPVFGRIIRKCCFLEIDREDPKKAFKTIVKAADLLKKGEVSIGVYPEGTRTKTGRLLPFHNGVFKIAQRAGASIVVVSVMGTENIHRNFPLHHSDVWLDVLEVLPPEEVAGARTDAIGARVRQDLERRLQPEDGSPVGAEG